MTRGEISELFGADTLVLDKFMRGLGLRRLAEQSWEVMDSENRAILEAYADGINDSVFGTSLTGDQSTGRLLPPEFYAFGISDLDKWRPWSPVDTLTLTKYKSYYLSWNWMGDLAREALMQAHPDLLELADDIVPFKSEEFVNLVTIIDEEDLKENG